MKKKRKIVAFVAVVLMFLFLVLSSSSLLSRTSKKEIKKISVIGIKQDSNQIEDFKRGIEEAANHWCVDVEYLEFSGKDMKLEEYIEREYQNAAEAMIVFSEKEAEVLSWLQSKKKKIPLIMVGAEEEGDSAIHVWYQMNDMAEQFVKKVQDEQGTEVVFLTDGSESSEKAGEILLKTFEEKGIAMKEKEFKEDEIEAYQKERAKIFICASSKITEELGEQMKSEGHKIYGIGYSNKVVRLIKDGKVDGVSAYNGYVLGIYALKAAEAAIDSKRPQEDTKVPCIWIDAENAEEEYEFLFPIY